MRKRWRRRSLPPESPRAKLPSHTEHTDSPPMAGDGFTTGLKLGRN